MESGLRGAPFSAEVTSAGADICPEWSGLTPSCGNGEQEARGNIFTFADAAGSWAQTNHRPGIPSYTRSASPPTSSPPDVKLPPPLPCLFGGEGHGAAEGRIGPHSDTAAPSWNPSKIFPPSSRILLDKLRTVS